MKRPVSPFRENADGLFVPEPLSRQRQVWTKDEVRLLNRAIKLVKGKGDAFLLACNHADCKEQKLQRLREAGGVLVFRCHHKDRVFSRSV